MIKNNEAVDFLNWIYENCTGYDTKLPITWYCIQEQKYLNTKELYEIFKAKNNLITKNMENENKNQKSELWNKIYDKVKELPKDNTVGDSIDHRSLSNQLEQLFIDEYSKEYNGDCKSN